MNARDVARAHGIEYLDAIPQPGEIPPGRVVVHNHVRPTRRLGSRGFRAWLAPLDDPGCVRRVVPCDCGWAPEIGAHYRLLGVGEGHAGA